MTISELPPCPNCGDRNLSEVCDYVEADRDIGGVYRVTGNQRYSILLHSPN